MDLKDLIREVPDFPKAGVNFKDVTTLIKDAGGLRYIIKKLAGNYLDKGVDVVVGAESRGFIIGTPLALELGVGFVPVRKAGKLPAKSIKQEYELEYGTDSLEIHEDAIKPGQKVLVVDDLIATGGTARATVKLVEKLGGKVISCAFIIELPFLKGKEKLKGYDVFSLVSYDSE